ncbi:MAG: PaaI family thioesterase [Pseudomonadota bacterium]
MFGTRDIERLQKNFPPFISLLGGKLVNLDYQTKSAHFTFDVPTDFCHSVDVIQGGFVTAMLDAAMSHAAFASDDSVMGLSSLEISTRYLDVARAGKLLAIGRVVRMSYKTAFLEGELRNLDDVLIATTQSVAKLSRRKEENPASAKAASTDASN